MNKIVEVKSGVNRGLFKWVSKDAIYYANEEGPLKRRRERE